MLSGVVDGLMESPEFLPAIAADVNQDHENWRAERRGLIDQMLGEPFVPDALIREASGLQEDAGLPRETCSASEMGTWEGLKLNALIELAHEKGVGDDEIDAAMESDAPKAALLQLLKEAC
jgi:hypothetical protein